MAGHAKNSGGISAAELMTQLQDDPEYQRKAQAAEAERQARVQELRHAEQPIVTDLRRAGVQVDSVWDLVNTAEEYPDALPVLMRHLELGGYPDRVMEGIGRALAVKPAVAMWNRLKALYLASSNPGEGEGTAVALAACATKAQLDDLIDLVSHDECGDSRIHFLRPIKRFGAQRGRDVLESLRTDSTFGKEATALLRR